MMYALLFLLTMTEVGWDGYHELIKNKRPNYFLSNVLRVVVGSLVVLAYGKTLALSIILIPMMIAGFSFIFDGSLNVLRTLTGMEGRPYYYLGSSNFENWQKEHGGAKRWFWIKALITVLSVALFEILK